MDLKVPVSIIIKGKLPWNVANAAKTEFSKRFKGLKFFLAPDSGSTTALKMIIQEVADAGEEVRCYTHMSGTAGKF